MSSILERLRETEAKRQEEELRKSNSKLSWKALSLNIILLRQVDMEGKRYNVFFIYTPTVFKTRGRYVLIDINDLETARKLLLMKGYRFLNFTVNDAGRVKPTEDDIPLIRLGEEHQPYKDIYSKDNSTNLEVIDLLDLLDLVGMLRGRLHLNPLESLPETEKYLDGTSDFQLSKDLSDYNVDVYDFTTSREAPTLSYGFLLIGKEEVEGKMIERKKYFSYPLLTRDGTVKVPRLRFTLPNVVGYRDLVEEYIGHILEDNSLQVLTDNKIHFTVDTSKLEGISTIHELPVVTKLVKDREQTRVVLRSLRQFKRVVRELSSRLKVSLYSKYDNLFAYDDLPSEDKEPELEARLIYKTEDTALADKPFKSLLKAINVDIGFVYNAVEGYLDGKTSEDVIEQLIERAGKVYLNPVMAEGFKALFICIPGKDNLREMFDEADRLSRANEMLGNSQKLRLHVFGLPESQEGLDYYIHMTSSPTVQPFETSTPGYLQLEFKYDNEKGLIEFSTDYKL